MNIQLYQLNRIFAIKDMALNKKSEFSSANQEIALFAKALSHPARVDILQHLSLQTNCICGELVDKMPLAQSTVSQHLKELKNAGLIKGVIEGPKTCYCIDFENFKVLYNKLTEYLDQIKTSQNQKCC